MRRVRFAWLPVLPAVLLAACAPANTSGAVHIGQVEGIVNGVMDRYVDRVLDHAEATNAVAVVLEIDTPGGQLGAMKHVAGRIEQSTVPVITWVGPPGAEAASAGTFIAMAGDIAAMAPNTTIGAATPVTAAGGDVEGDLGRKVENDAVAFARGVAEHRGRNADWAEQAVREAASATPNEALELNVIDLVAPTLTGLLSAVDGREVTLLDGTRVTLSVSGVPRLENGPNGYERVLAIVSDPLVLLGLFVLALIGIGIEVLIPGVFVPGTIGLIAVILFFLGAGTLLPGEAAIALTIVAIILIGAEFFIPSGVLGAMGGAALVLAVSIVIGQISTTIPLATALLVVLALILAIGVPLLVWLRRYIATTQEAGTRLT